MREILFRGKCLDNGEWIEGDLKHDDLDFDTDIVYIYFHNKIEGRYETAEVDPATIGQFTGIYDKNGKRIFEGDIIEYKTIYEWDKKPIKRAEVVFENGMFSPAGVIMDLSRSKIIGNVHDNPELLKGE